MHIQTNSFYVQLFNLSHSLCFSHWKYNSFCPLYWNLSLDKSLNAVLGMHVMESLDKSAEIWAGPLVVAILILVYVDKEEFGSGLLLLLDPQLKVLRQVFKLNCSCLFRSCLRVLEDVTKYNATRNN